MQTLILVGASGTRSIERPGELPWLYTPRRVDESSAPGMTTDATEEPANSLAPSGESARSPV
jgi:hypothetical protein